MLLTTELFCWKLQLIATMKSITMPEDKTAFVTGGAEGIGACTVDLLCRKGYGVVFCDIDDAKGIEREKLLRDGGLNAYFSKGDVSSSDDMRKISSEIKKTHGSLDILVNNAGIADPAMEFPTEDPSNWNRVISTNLSGVFFAVNSLLNLMPEGSSIVNIASTRAFQSEKNTLAYSASKGGVVALTHSLAVTLSSRGLRVNCISPGWIDTSSWKLPPQNSPLEKIDHLQHPSGRAGVPRDVANMVAFLCSKDGEWINGENIMVDGGMTKRMIYFDEDVLDEIRGFKGL